jgi:hypothetical protein
LGLKNVLLQIEVEWNSSLVASILESLQNLVLKLDGNSLVIQLHQRPDENVDCLSGREGLEYFPLYAISECLRYAVLVIDGSHFSSLKECQFDRCIHKEKNVELLICFSAFLLPFQ